MIIKHRISYKLVDEEGRTYQGTVFTELDHADFLESLRKKHRDLKSLYSEYQGSIEEPELETSLSFGDVLCLRRDATPRNLAVRMTVNGLPVDPKKYHPPSIGELMLTLKF